MSKQVGETKTPVRRRVKKKPGPRKKRRRSIKKKDPPSNNQCPKVNKEVTLYKTERCRFVEEGRICPHPNCMFAHSEEELRERPRHPKYKCQKCRNYWVKGVCYYGHRCDYLHRDLKNCTKAGNSVADRYFWENDRLPVFASIEKYRTPVSA